MLWQRWNSPKALGPQVWLAETWGPETDQPGLGVAALPRALAPP